MLFFHGSSDRGDDNTAQLRHGVLPIINRTAKLGTQDMLEPLEKAGSKPKARQHPEVMSGIVAHSK